MVSAPTIRRSMSRERQSALNSDRIRQVFGSYSVDVLQQQAHLRIASLCSHHGGRTICRTLAVTLFAESLPDALKDADRRIREGASIGETLRDLGFITQKTDTHWCSATAGAQFARLTQGEVSAGSLLVARLYKLVVDHNGERWEYATIAEAYHPAHEALNGRTLRAGDTPAMPERHREALNELLRAL